MFYVWLEPKSMSPEVLAEAVRHINRLLKQLSPRADRSITSQQLVDVTAEDTRIITACEHSQQRGSVAPLICGMATLVPVLTLTRYIARVEDVVVDAGCRNQGIARKMLGRLIAEAQHAGFEQIDLTSNPAREAANALYLKLGFIRRDTNVYRLIL